MKAIKLLITTVLSLNVIYFNFALATEAKSIRENVEKNIQLLTKISSSTNYNLSSKDARLTADTFNDSFQLINEISNSKLDSTEKETLTFKILNEVGFAFLNITNVISGYNLDMSALNNKEKASLFIKNILATLIQDLNSLISWRRSIISKEYTWSATSEYQKLELVKQLAVEIKSNLSKIKIDESTPRVPALNLVQKRLDTYTKKQSFSKGMTGAYLGLALFGAFSGVTTLFLDGYTLNSFLSNMFVLTPFFMHQATIKMKSSAAYQSLVELGEYMNQNVKMRSRLLCQRSI